MNASVRKIADARPVAVELPPQARPINWSRLVKLSASVAALLVGAYAVASNSASVTSNNAVVTAYTLTLRTPIDGTLSGDQLVVGRQVSKGNHIAVVDNPLVDQHALADFRIQLEKARATSAAITQELSNLEVLRFELLARSEAFISATVARLEGLLVESQGKLDGALIKRDLAKTTLGRRQNLNGSGYSSAADLDKAQTDFDVADKDVQSYRGTVASIAAQLEAARKGIVADNNSSDAPYSQQRADEIAIRSGELRRQQLALKAEIAQTEINVERENERVAKLRETSIVAPASGMVWKLNTSSGERIATGESVAQIVDCGAAFILASIPQDRVPEIEIGSQVEYRLSGDTDRHAGRVVSVTGNESDREANLAAMPFVTRGQPAAIVRIAVDTSGGTCLIGRTARVVMPTTSLDVTRFFQRLI